MGLLRRVLLAVFAPAAAQSERHMTGWYLERLTQLRAGVIEMQRLHAKCVTRGIPTNAVTVHREREAYDAELGRIARIGYPVGHLRLPPIDLEATARELDCAEALVEVDRLLNRP